jgi:hypothetical protein
MDAQKVTQRGWDREAIEAMGPSVQTNPWGCTVLETLGGSQLFEVEDGATRMLIATKGMRRQDVATLEITGLVSSGARMQTHQMGQALDTLSNIYGADYLAMYTPHPHLMRGAQRLGFYETGRLFMKRVTDHGQQ